MWRAAQEPRADRRRSEAERWLEFTALQERSAAPTAELTQTLLLRPSDWLWKENQKGEALDVTRGNLISENSEEHWRNCRMRLSLLLLLLPQ